jgi:hypothetical protein
MCISNPSFLRNRLSDYLQEYYSPFYYRAGEPNSLSNMENRVHMNRLKPLSYYKDDKISYTCNIQTGDIITIKGTRMLSEVAEEEFLLSDDCYIMEYLSRVNRIERWYRDDANEL